MDTHIPKASVHLITVRSDNIAWAADIATFCWIFAAPWAGLTLDKYPNLKAWHDKILERPAVREGLDVPEPNRMMLALKDPEIMKELVEDAQAMMVSTKL